MCECVGVHAHLHTCGGQCSTHLFSLILDLIFEIASVNGWPGAYWLLRLARLNVSPKDPLISTSLCWDYRHSLPPHPASVWVTRILDKVLMIVQQRLDPLGHFSILITDFSVLFALNYLIGWDFFSVFLHHWVFSDIGSPFFFSASSLSGIRRHPSHVSWVFLFQLCPPPHKHTYGEPFRFFWFSQFTLYLHLLYIAWKPTDGMGPLPHVCQMCCYPWKLGSASLVMSRKQ